jgi:hypothetical protein
MLNRQAVTAANKETDMNDTHRRLISHIDDVRASLRHERATLCDQIECLQGRMHEVTRDLESLPDEDDTARLSWADLAAAMEDSRVYGGVPDELLYDEQEDETAAQAEQERLNAAQRRVGGYVDARLS